MKNGFKFFAYYLIIPAFLAMIFNVFVNKHLLLANILFYLVLLIIFSIIERKEIKKQFNDFKKKVKKDIFIIIKWILIEFILMVVSNYIIGLFVSNIPANELNNREFLMNNPILTLIYLLLIAPSVEEFVFRFSFRSIKNYYLYTILTSLLFASLHLISIDNLMHLWYIIPYFVMGFGFANIYYKCQNYFDSTIGHIIHNILCVIIILVF